ncbi:hypothetical protein HWV23_04290 [Natronomonas halophila]|uniref:DUF6517 family protein n=1 Tax=Natronomonas halophila TaxID=2747817 RepID=UPI0015B6845C|nr:DUF6517 family protein [Natronomonas halophila]QLD84968.1 hypothetical protein HWV23_04290 [Natronomonas halophila]
MKRRALLAGIPMALFAGCTSLVVDGEAEFEAQTATVSESARSETDYEEVEVTENTVERELPAGRTVRVVNSLAEYSRTVNTGLGVSGELARFTAVATPEVDIAGQAMNPVADMDNDELAERVQQQYDNVRNIESVGDRTTTVGDTETTVSKYDAEAQTNGQNVDINIHICRIQNEGDFVICAAVHPRDIDEESRVDTLLAGIQHPTNSSSE